MKDYKEMYKKYNYTIKLDGEELNFNKENPKNITLDSEGKITNKKREIPDECYCCEKKLEDNELRATYEDYFYMCLNCAEEFLERMGVTKE